MANERLVQAWQAHAADDYGRAELLCRAALGQDGQNAEAWRLLGEVCLFQGKYAATADAYAQALRLAPSPPEAHNNLGVALANLGRLREAVEHYRQAVQLRPAYVEARNNLAVALTDLGLPDEAAEQLRRALEVKPDYAEGHNSLGNALAALGRLDEAVAAYRHALRLRPAYPKALNNLGLALMDLGKLEDADTSIQQALRLTPQYPEGLNNRGAVLRKLGKPEEAAASYRAALRHRPDYAEAYHNLGLVLMDQGKLDDAVIAFRDALRHRPNYAEAHLSLGNVFAARGEPAAAALSYREAARVQPGYPEAYHSLGVTLQKQGRLDEALASFEQALWFRPDYAEAHDNRGTALHKAGRLDEAVVSYQTAIRLRPDLGQAHSNLGAIFVELKRWEAAVTSFRETVRLKPDSAQGHTNLGIALWGLGRLEEAAASCRVALRLDPDYADAYSTLAATCAPLGKLEEAAANARQAIRLKPDHIDAHCNLAMALLGLGDYEQGWREYEWRWQSRDVSKRPFTQPRWDGAPLEGRTLLLYAEQGFGDTLHFIRYVPLVKARGGIVVVECQQALVPLLEGRLRIDRVVAQNAPLPSFDVQAPLLSLPFLLGTTLATLPADVPYLDVPADLIEQRRAEVRAGGDFLIGIAWQGNPGHRFDCFRSFPLTCFEPLARLPGVRLVSLQRGAGSEQVRALARRFAVAEVSGETFLDTAAVVKNLDLVIACDTAVAHLAGALAVPVWVALPLAPDWRWLLEREDNPWYPTARLFRQSARGDWDGVFQRLTAAARERLGHASRVVPRGGMVQVEIGPGELLDRIALLQVQGERLCEANELAELRRELAGLAAVRERALPGSAELDRLAADLKAVHERLAQAEEGVRRCERRQEFGECFVELVRAAQRHSEERAALRRRVDALLGRR